MQNRLVSVVVSVFNAETYLPQALKSIFGQTYQPVEIIVVDDGSTDQSGVIARSFPQIRYIYQENRGEGMAKNRGINAARGEFIAFLDADDIWLPDKLKRQIFYLDEHPEIDFVLVQQQYFLAPGAEFPSVIPKEFRHQGHVGFGPSSMLARKMAFEKVGLFDPAYSRHSADADWFFRAADSGIKKGIIEEVLLQRRIHGRNVSFSNMDNNRKRRMEIIRASIARKRETIKQKHTGI